MVSKMRALSIYSLASIAAVTSLCGMNVPQLNYVYLKPTFHEGTRFQLAYMALTGLKNRSFDSCCQTNVMRIWNKDQNALAMLLGNPNSPAGRLADGPLAGVVDDGVRGHFLVSGDLDLHYALNFAARYVFGHDLSLGIYLPYYSMSLNNVSWKDQTLDLTPDDARVKEFLTDDFIANVSTLGCLDLNGWKKKGPGDLIILLDWMKNYPQAKPMLKNVWVNWRIGTAMPTGRHWADDLNFAFPFGYDGAIGMIFGGGITLSLGDIFKAGFDAEFLHLFGNTRCRRIKTDCDQTDLLLLNRTQAYKDFGLTQQFNLFLEFFEFFKGMSFKFDYQYLKHGDDALCLDNNEFSNSIANTARNLEFWTAHTGVFKLGYDFSRHQSPLARVNPRLELFATVPLEGTRSADFSTIGIIATLDF